MLHFWHSESFHYVLDYLRDFEHSLKKCYFLYVWSKEQWKGVKEHILPSFVSDEKFLLE